MKSDYPRAVVAMAGARDHFQLPLALSDANLLESVVTDLYWPRDNPWFSRTLTTMLPSSLLSARYAEGLSSSKARSSLTAVAIGAINRRLGSQEVARARDRVIGRKAGRIALRENAAIFSYAYYASEALTVRGGLPRYRFFFQLQADPRTLRTLLRDELEATPSLRRSLYAEYELSLSERSFALLCSEPYQANGWVSPSTFAARTLTDHGILSERIHVVPYGVDGSLYTERVHPPTPSGRLRVVYVGSMTPRKGLMYALEAMNDLGPQHVELTICTHDLVMAPLLQQYPNLRITVKRGLSGRALCLELHRHDVFVLPSLAESFGHVILEAMSAGLPVIATPHTCAPDVMVNGVHGFIVPIRDSDALRRAFSWFLSNTDALPHMGQAAATRAREYTWSRFRVNLVASYMAMVDDVDLTPSTACASRARNVDEKRG